jgi:hypothetical protein
MVTIYSTASCREHNNITMILKNIFYKIIISSKQIRNMNKKREF